MRPLLNRFNISQINGIKYQFLMVIALRAQQSIQKRKLPLGFLIKITSIAIGNELALINPLSRYLSKYFLRTQSLFQDILYRGLNLGYFPSLITILQLYCGRVRSLSDRKSWYGQLVTQSQLASREAVSKKRRKEYIKEKLYIYQSCRSY